MKVAEDGDLVAVDVIKQGARSLAFIITTCAEVLAMQDEPYRIAATGGLVSRGGWYFDLTQQAISEKHSQATMVQPKFEPAVGAVLLGLKELDIEWDKSVVDNMETSNSKL